ncbi:MAG TPA: ABC transporter permease [Bryobacterales bacterium]|nr:ABC transporter permease [Bryobacterales bacterium]
MRRSRSLPLVALAAYAFLHLPVLVLIVFSFNESRFTVWTGLSWKWYRELARNARMLDALENSLLVAVAATVISTVIGTLAAYAMDRLRTRGERALDAALQLSIVTPEIVTGISLLAFFQLVFRFADFGLGLDTILIAHVAFSIAFVVIVVRARLAALDPALEEAAMDLGAGRFTTFVHVTLPLLQPGIVAAALLAFILSFDDYVITSLVAGVGSETLPMVIYSMARRGVSPVVNALSAILIVALGGLILIADRLQAGTGEGGRGDVAGAAGARGAVA